MSAADLSAVLLARHLRYDFDTPENRGNDHLVFSKGHASPLLYALYKTAGAIDDDELLTFREFGSRLQGHPTPEIPWVDVATGSLGQGLPISSASPSPAGGSNPPTSGCGCSAATPRWPRARCGRPSSTLAMRASTT